MNQALTSDRKYQDHTKPLRKAHYKLLQLILANLGEDIDTYKILEPVDCTDRLETECRKYEWVEFILLALTSGVSFESLPDIKSCGTLDIEGMEIPVLT